jgi:hypothetical protein
MSSLVRCVGVTVHVHLTADLPFDDRPHSHQRAPFLWQGETAFLRFHIYERRIGFSPAVQQLGRDV